MNHGQLSEMLFAVRRLQDVDIALKIPFLSKLEVIKP